MSQPVKSRVFFLVLCLMFALAIIGTMNQHAASPQEAGDRQRSARSLKTMPSAEVRTPAAPASAAVSELESAHTRTDDRGTRVSLIQRHRGLCDIR